MLKFSGRRKERQVAACVMGVKCCPYQELLCSEYFMAFALTEHLACSFHVSARPCQGRVYFPTKRIGPLTKANEVSLLWK